MRSEVEGPPKRSAFVTPFDPFPTIIPIFNPNMDMASVFNALNVTVFKEQQSIYQMTFEL